MKKYLLIFLFALVAMGVNAQQSDRIAVFEPAISFSSYNESRIKNDIGGALESEFTKKGNIVVDRNTTIAEQEKVICDGHEIDDACRIEVGKKLGATIVCATQITGNDNAMSITSRLVVVETSRTLRTHVISTSINSMETDRVILAKKMADDVNKAEIYIENSGGKEQITVNNAFAIISKNAPWCKAEKEGESIRIICDQPNKSVTERVHKIEIEMTNENRTCIVTVTQKGVSSPIQKEQFKFGHAGKDKEQIKFWVNDPYKIEKNADWATITSKGTDYLDVKILKNESIEERQGTITVKFGDNEFPVTILLSQDGCSLVEDTGTRSFSKSGGKETIKVNTDNYTVQLPVWLSYTIRKDNDNNNYLDIQCIKNKFEKRSADIIIIKGDKRADIRIEQEGTHSNNKTKEPYNTVLKNPQKNWGISVGYVQRGWNLCIDKNEEISSWEQPRDIPGGQIGLKFNYFFNGDNPFGLGIDWGLHIEYATTNKTALSPGNEEVPLGREYAYNLWKTTLYIPVHLLYKYDFIKEMGIFVYGGIGVNFGLAEKIKATYKGDTEPFYQAPAKFDFSSTLNRFNLSTEFGGGVQFFRMMISTTLANRIFNPTETFTKEQKLGLTVNLSYMFGKRVKNT